MSIEVVDIPGVSDQRRSVLYSPSDGRTVVVLVHGILDNVWRWITPRDVSDGTLPDVPPPIPLFDASSRREAFWGTWDGPFEGEGLMHRLQTEGTPTVAYSYQDVLNPIASMKDAVDRLHRVVAWALENLGATKVILVGHSRGGLVCRHALTTDSSTFEAKKFHSVVDRLITLCTPHQGSQVAGFAELMAKPIEQYRLLSESLGGILPSVAPLEWGAGLICSIGTLTPTSSEILQAASNRIPLLPGGYFAIAGSSASYFCASFRAGGGLRLPPSIGIPEFIDGEGDMAVSVASALDAPVADADRTRIFPFNHLTLPYAPEVHDQIVAWTTTAC